jgi:site-specific recombinase XerD
MEFLPFSFATNLRSLGVDVKVSQKLLRHANSRTTLDIYTHAVSARKHEATGIEHPSAPLELQAIST